MFGRQMAGHHRSQTRQSKDTRVSVRATGVRCVRRSFSGCFGVDVRETRTAALRAATTTRAAPSPVPDTSGYNRRRDGRAGTSDIYSHRSTIAHTLVTPIHTAIVTQCNQ